MLHSLWLGMVCQKNAYALTFVLPNRENAVGQTESTRTQAGQTLSDIGIRFDFGYLAIRRANPRVDAH